MTNEKRLIDANALIDRFDYERFLNHDFAEDLVNEAPTIDAVEVPPVKIGDTAYFIINKKIYEAKICLISFAKDRYTTDTEIRGEVQKNHSVSAKFSDWGKSVFATREEAEKVLYPCEYCFCGTYRSCDGCSYGEVKEDHQP